MTQNSVICLTGIKNEAWIVNTTLNENSKVFSEQIYYDQSSSDDTTDIISKNKKARVIQNQQKQFDEKTRMLQLHAIASQSGAKTYFNLDADEFILVLDPVSFWQEIHEATKSTAFSYEWLNIHPSRRKYWSSGYKIFGATTSGGGTVNGTFHIDRVPKRDKLITSNAAKVIHLQYLLPENIKEKQAWYILHEIQTKNMTSGVEIFRKYSHMSSFLNGSGLHDISELKIDKELFANISIKNSDWAERLKEKQAEIGHNQSKIPPFAQQYLNIILLKPHSKGIANLLIKLYINLTKGKSSLLIRLADKCLRGIGL